MASPQPSSSSYLPIQSLSQLLNSLRRAPPSPADLLSRLTRLPSLASLAALQMDPLGPLSYAWEIASEALDGTYASNRGMMDEPQGFGVSQDIPSAGL